MEEESGSYQYSYDALSRLTGVAKDNNPIKSFGYDTFGNRSRMSDKAGTTNYRYNALNQLMHLEDARQKQDFSYDKRGNLTQILENGNIKNTYEFSPLNRLTKATNSNGQVASYDYNGLGFRVGKQVSDADNLNPTKHISYILDQTKQYHNLLQMGDGTQTQSYAWDGNVAFADGNAYLQDELGSPLRYMDNTGNTIDSYGYDEFGGDVYGNQGITQPFGFTGYTADIIAGTYFAQAREYVSGMGRFASEDLVKGAIDAPFTMNHYAYCWNQPMDWVDLDGLYPVVAPQSPLPIGEVYRIVTPDGTEYIGSSMHDLKTRFGTHRIKTIIMQPETRIYTKQVNASLNIAASGRGTPRSAVNEALRSAEQPVIKQRRSALGKDNVINKRAAAAGTNAETWTQRHSVSVGAERKLLINPITGAKTMVFTGLVFTNAIRVNHAIQTSNMVFAPLVFHDENGAFTVQSRTNWFGASRDWQITYLDGTLAGESIPITRSEFNDLVALGRELWGYVNIWGRFVLGTLRPYLPTIDIVEGNGCIML